MEAYYPKQCICFERKPNFKTEYVSLKSANIFRMKNFTRETDPDAISCVLFATIFDSPSEVEKKFTASLLFSLSNSLCHRPSTLPRRRHNKRVADKSPLSTLVSCNRLAIDNYFPVKTRLNLNTSHFNNNKN